MKRLIDDPEVASAAADAQDVIDRLTELAIDADSSRARVASEVLGMFGARVVDAIMAAFPRAATAEQRSRLLLILDYVTPRWYLSVDKFLRRIARDDPDWEVQHQAKDLWRYLMEIDEDDEDDEDDLDEEEDW